MKRGKKAQFYIIGAVVIIIVMISIANISNYVLVKKEPKKFMDIGDTLNLEGEKVGIYIKYNDEKEENVTKKISEMIGGYMGAGNEKVDIVIIRGNATGAEITVIAQNSTGRITLSSGANTFQTGSVAYLPYTTTVSGNNVTVNILNENYTFELGGDEKFMFIMTKSEGFEQYVQSNWNE